MAIKALGIALALSAGTTTAEPFQTALLDGMTIRTSNSVAAVHVRAKSHGPGFCATKVRSSTGKVVAVAAPPIAWSPWHEIDGHMGSVSLTYSTTIECDTGAVFEIRYFKQ